MKPTYTKLTFGGLPACYITVDDQIYIAVKANDVDAVALKVMTSMTREIPETERAK